MIEQMSGASSEIVAGSGFAGCGRPPSLTVIELSLPPEFAVKCPVVAVTGQAYELECLVGAADDDLVGSSEWSADLPIDHERHAGWCLVDAEPIGAIGGINNWAYGECMWADWGNSKDGQVLAKNGAPRREIVGGGAHGGADDQSVAAEGCDFFVVDPQVDIEHF